MQEFQEWCIRKQIPYIPATITVFDRAEFYGFYGYFEVATDEDAMLIKLVFYQ